MLEHPDPDPPSDDDLADYVAMAFVYLILGVLLIGWIFGMIQRI